MNCQEFVKVIAQVVDESPMKRTRRLVLVAIATATIVCFVDTPAASAHSARQSSSTILTATYKVRSGDNLAGIARKTGTRLNDLLLANNITVTSTIHPGQTLTLPPATARAKNFAAAQRVQTTYTVVSGDYLASISTNNGVTLKELLAANGLTASSAIRPGQVLLLPPTSEPIVQPTPTKSSPAPNSANAAPSDGLIAYLRAQIGKPYRFFTAGPDTFDCSGLVVAGYKQIGITLVHQSRMQATMGTAVDFRTEPLVAGDLVFLRSSIDPTQIGHVGVAIDSKTWIQAPGTGMSVRIRAMPSDDRIESVRRILIP